MPEYRRPELVAADPVEASDFLIGRFGPGHSIRQVLGDALYITIDQTLQALEAALADYIPGAAIAANAAAEAEARAVFMDFTPAQLTKIRAVYAGTDAFTKVQSDRLLAALAILAHRRLG